MSRQCILPNQDYYDSWFVFIVSRTCFDQVTKYIEETEDCVDPIEFLSELFVGDRYLIASIPDTKTKYENSFNVYVGNYVFQCHIVDEGVLLRTFRTCSPKDVNYSIWYGVSFESTQGTVLRIKLTAYGIFLYYVNGYSVQERDLPDVTIDGEEFVNTVQQKTSDLKKTRNKARRAMKNESVENDQIVSDVYSKYLDIAESYEMFEDEDARIKAQSTSGISCSNPTPAEYFDRQDRIAYTYDVNDDYDESIYAVGRKVNIELEEGNTISASIIETGERNGKKTITLLFDEVLSFNKLPSVVVVKLGYSSIIADVQQAVIDDLRQGKTKASFLDLCLGQHKCEPYEIEGLEELEERLMHPKEGLSCTKCG